MRNAPLAEKKLLRTEEALELYGMSRFYFYKFLREDKTLPFLVYYFTRRLINREAFEKYMERHPEHKERLKYGGPSVS